MNNKLTGSDYLLLLLYLNNQKPIYGAVKLEKMMFIFDKEIKKIISSKGFKIDKMPEFFAYHFGPFSKDVYVQIELFKNIKFVDVIDKKTKEGMDEVDDVLIFDDSISYNELTNDGKLTVYTIANKGVAYVEEKIVPLLSDEIINLLENFKSKIVSLPSRSLLKYVYSKYPEYTVNSIIKEDVLNDY